MPGARYEAAAKGEGPHVVEESLGGGGGAAPTAPSPLHLHLQVHHHVLSRPRSHTDTKQLALSEVGADEDKQKTITRESEKWPAVN